MKKTKIDFWRYPDQSINALTVADMKKYGYNKDDMFPIKAELIETIKETCSIYMLFPNNQEKIVTNSQEIVEHEQNGGIFGVKCSEWLEKRDPYYHSYFDGQVYTIYDNGRVINQIPHNGEDTELYYALLDTYNGYEIISEDYIARDDPYNKSYFSQKDKTNELLNRVANEFFDGDYIKVLFLSDEELQSYYDKLL